MRRLLYSPWQTLSIPFALTHWSAFDLSSLWPTCSLPRTHHIHHDIHDTYISQIFDSQKVNLSNIQHFCVWKHVFWVDETLENLFQNSSKHALRCATTSQLFFLRHFGLRRPRGATRPISCFCFCSLCRKGHHCGNKLFPASVSVILTGKPIADQTPPKIACSNGHRSLLGFAAKVMSRDKFWKQDFCMNTLFKFVRVVVKDRLTNLEQRWSGLSLLRVGLQG